MDLLTGAKNHYWRALKTSSSDMERHNRMLHVNLGNALSQAGRIVEAFQYYDEVLQEDPEFAKANGNRAGALQNLATISGHSTSLLLEAAQGYRKGAEGKNVPTRVREEWLRRARSIKETLKAQVQDVPDPDEDRRRTEKEFESHSGYRQFSLRNFLSLNEHALYCRCAAARKDTLTVQTNALAVEGEFIPAMEHRLDRVKSEFAFARYSFYEALNQDTAILDGLDEDVHYVQPFDAESIGLRSESLRASFRTCFGILDKIARALCELFDLPVQDGESINFHQSLWNPNSPRWEALNAIERNSFHSALYSQATDLSNKTGGEWAVYRNWRNAVEHGFLVLQEHPNAEVSEGVVHGTESVMVVPLGRFQRKALHLLQLTRSAIFNFAFCARVEGWKVANGFR
jgi:tetratricopeptide (TPR) repeat protein